MLSEKAKLVLPRFENKLSKTVSDVISILLDNEDKTPEWADISALDDVETYLLPIKYRLTYTDSKALSIVMERFQDRGLHGAAAAIFSVMDLKRQYEIHTTKIADMAIMFSTADEIEGTMKIAAQFFHVLHRSLAPWPDQDHSKALNVLASMMIRMDVDYPSLRHYDESVKRVFEKYIPELDGSKSMTPTEFKEYLRRDAILAAHIKNKSTTTGKNIPNSMLLSDRRFENALSASDSKLVIGSNFYDVLITTDKLLKGLSSSRSTGSGFSSQEKVLDLIHKNLARNKSDLRKSVLALAAIQNSYRKFNSISKLLPDVLGDLKRAGCDDGRLREIATSLSVAFVTAFSNKAYVDLGNVEWQHGVLQGLFTHSDFDEVQIKTSASGRSYFADFVSLHYPERVTDLTNTQKGRLFANELGI